jgi:uncharacterized OB-fold protein
MHEGKPLPWATNERVAEEFWDAAKRHELVLPHCINCGRIYWYPREQCPNPACYTNAKLGREIDWVPVSPRGRLYSYTIVQQAALGFEDDVPYVYCVVEMDAGREVRMLSNLVDCPLDEIEIGMPVELFFEDVTEEITLYKFRPLQA